MGVKYTEEDKKQLPCITLCPWSAFKKQGFFFTTEEFAQHTFESYELLSNTSTLGNAFNSSNFQLEEIRSPQLGRCYMICKLAKVSTRESVLIALNKIGAFNGT